MSDLGLSGLNFAPNDGSPEIETSDGSSPIIGEQHDSNNIITQWQKEKPNLGGPDNDDMARMFIPDVRFNCLQCSHQLTSINHALQGANYNTPITREVIYTIGQSGFTQQYNNAKLVAELLRMVEEVPFPIC